MKLAMSDKEIAIITNLPKNSASAQEIADLYSGRWTIETALQRLESHLNSEINTLGYLQWLRCLDFVLLWFLILECPLLWRLLPVYMVQMSLKTAFPVIT